MVFCSTGEITMKLKQPWKSEFTDHASPAYQILAGNLATAVSLLWVQRLHKKDVCFRVILPRYPAFAFPPGQILAHQLQFASVLVLCHAVKKVSLTYFPRSHRAFISSMEKSRRICIFSDKNSFAKRSLCQQYLFQVMFFTATFYPYL